MNNANNPTEARIDENWMLDSGLLQHAANISREEARQAADSLQKFFEDVEGAEWLGGDRWSFPSREECEQAQLAWLDALNTREDLRWAAIA